MKNSRRRDSLEYKLLGLINSGEGLIIRPAAQLVDDELIFKELLFLRTRWSKILDNSISATATTCLLAAPNLIERILRDYLIGDTTLVIDDRQLYLDLTKKRKQLEPMISCIRFHNPTKALFESFGIIDQIEELNSRSIDLSKGGKLTFDFTEALTVIDVDMGSSANSSNKEGAVYAINISAAIEIARQIRLRNIAGLIIIDFINMRRRDHRRKLVDTIKKELRGFSVPIDVLGMTASGLVEITRRRDGPALHELLLQNNTNSLELSDEVLVCEALRQVLRATGAGSFELSVSPRLACLLNGQFEQAFKETARRLGGGLSLIESKEAKSFVIKTKVG